MGHLAGRGPPTAARVRAGRTSRITYGLLALLAHPQVERAVEVEINTGPAVRPGAEGDQGQGQGNAGAGAVDDLEEWERGEFGGEAATAAPAAVTSRAAAGRHSGAGVAAAPAAAPPPAAAAADDGGGKGGKDKGDDEYDPLDAFMAEIDQEVAANRPTGRGGAAAEACDEEADPATEYMEVRARIVYQLGRRVAGRLGEEMEGAELGARADGNRGRGDGAV